MKHISQIIAEMIDAGKIPVEKYCEDPHNGYTNTNERTTHCTDDDSASPVDGRSD